MTAIVTPTPIDLLPPAPLITDTESEHNAKAYPLLEAQAAMVPQINASALATHQNATAALENATAASSSASAATGSATSAQSYRDAAAGHSLAAAAQASAAAGSASAAAGSATAASKLNLGDKTSAPSTDNQGQPLRAGATYYDTTLSKWRVWSGSAWADGITSVAGVASVAGKTGNVTLTGADIEAQAFPSIRPTLLLDFANSRAVDPRISFSRASPATRVNQRGLIESVPINTPRIQFDIVTLECKGLLIEEPRTNLLTNSNVFTAGGWAKGADAVLSTGSMLFSASEAATVISSTGAAGSYISQGVAMAKDVFYTVSIHARLKAGTPVGGQILRLDYFDADGTARNVVLPVGSVVLDSRPRRYSLTVKNLAAGTGAGNFGINMGVGVELEIFGAQLEAGDFQTSYIPTTGAAATRAADVCAVTGFPDWYRAAEGTFVFECEFPGISQGVGFVVFRNDLWTNYAQLASRGGSAVGFNLTTSGVNVASSGSHPVVNNTLYKFGFALKNMDVAFAVGGLAPQVFAQPIGADMSVIDLSGASKIIRRLVYYPQRLANSELQALTV